jgi:hypothetical protein
MFKHFYHERVRKSVAIFGAMFNNIYVVRTTKAKSKERETLSQMKVPLAYGPQRKFLERISEMFDGEEEERQLAIKLPRMSFEITAIAYDPQRQLPKMNYFHKKHVDNDTAGAKFQVSTPYIISFELNIYAKQQDDALQIVEQILPYFSPQYTVPVKPIEDYPDIVEDVPVILTSVSFSDDYEGPIENRRTIVYTLSFEMKISFFGPKPDEGAIINRIDVDFWHMDPEYYLETLRVETEPRPVSPDSDYNVNIDVIDINDAFIQNPVEVPVQYFTSATFDLRVNSKYDSGTTGYTLVDSDINNLKPDVGTLLNISPAGLLTANSTEIPAVDLTKYTVLNPRGTEIDGYAVVYSVDLSQMLTTEDSADVDIFVLENVNELGEPVAIVLEDSSP